MDDRLRVDDDVDLVVAETEQMVSLDQLEALVHERRRVDRDLAAHVPGRVAQRLLDGDALELAPRAAAERAARRGEHQLDDRARRLALDQLVQRRMLGVDRDDARAGRLGQLHHELASDDEGLLVGQREVDPFPQRRHRRAQAGGADECVEGQFRAGLDDQANEPLGAGQHLAVRPSLGRLGRGHGIAQRHPADVVGAGLLDQLLP